MVVPGKEERVPGLLRQVVPVAVATMCLVSPGASSGQLEGGVDFASATGRACQSTSSLYTVIENDRPGWYRLDFSRKKMEHIAVCLAGQRLEHGDIVHLDRGRFPLMVHVSIGTVGNWETNARVHRLCVLCGGSKGHL
jgi:hypothetical protein